MSVRQPTRKRSAFRRIVVPCLILVVGVAGCSGKMSSVSGKVTYNGKPVTGGSLSFTPVASGEKEPGKPAAGVVQPDGTYRLGTNSASDGAVVGRHRVSFTPPVMNFPEGKEPKPGDVPPRSGFEGLVPKVEEVEVKSGANTIDIELALPGRR